MARMFTTCPGCRMNLAVTAMDLRIGQGYVRCGRCERVFNALISLSEDLEPGDESGHAATGTTTVPALEEEAADEIGIAPPQPQTAQPREDAPTPAPAATADAPRPAPDLAPPAPPATVTAADGDDAAEWAVITPVRSGETARQKTAAPDLDVDAHHDLDVVDSQATGTFETIVLEGDTFLQTEEHVAEEEIDEQLQRIARQIGGEDAREGEPGGDPGMPASGALAAPEELDPDAAVGNAPRTHWGWGVAAGLLALLLLGQVVHHHRQALVSRVWLEQPLKSIYGLFGSVLEPAWNLQAYDLRQLGGEAPPGATTRIVLRASVQNRAAVSQPPPLIRVVLQDRYGNAVSTASIPPQDYLRGEAPARMAPDQRLDAELALDDPNRQAEGFELDVCLPGADGRIHCSTDP